LIPGFNSKTADNRAEHVDGCEAFDDHRPPAMC
jgi:hypothetical protein